MTTAAKPSTNGYLDPTANVLSRLEGVRGAGDGKWQAICPAHDDSTPSLSISRGDDDRCLLDCKAGCDTTAVVRAMGLEMKDLFLPSANGSGKAKTKSKLGRIVGSYDYRDAQGKACFQSLRYDPKDFRQRRARPGGGWDWSVEGCPILPYRLPEMLAEPKRPVFVNEGEKDVDNTRTKLGQIATCNVGGAGKWTAEHAKWLAGRDVVILPDNDKPGRDHALQVAYSLVGIAKSIRIVELPGLPEKGDVTDWIDAGGTREKLRELVNATPLWTPADAPPAPWPEIVYFESLDLPEFPVDVLPPLLREWVESESHATQTPADLAGLLALSVCSAAIARHVEVVPRPGWREPVNLYVAVLLAPGNRKSCVFADATAPLRELESEQIEAARPIVARAQSERRQDEAKLRRLEKQAATKGDMESRYEAAKMSEDMAEQTELTLPRLIVDDATSEKLGMMLAEQGGRIASMSPEGGVFDLMAGLYSKSGIPQFGTYLMGHSGDDLITDRVGRKSVHVEQPALTCAYAMQPEVIAGLASRSAFRGRGLLARFLYAAPKSWIGRREIAPEPVDDQTREAYRRLVRALSGNCEDIEYVFGVVQQPVKRSFEDIEYASEEFKLLLSGDAAGVLREWEEEIEEMLADGGAMEIMRDWGAKLAGATLRIAAVIHCVKHGLAGCMEAATVREAVELAEFLVPHAGAVLGMMQATEDDPTEDAKYVLKWIEENQLRGFTKRECHQHGRRRFPKVEDLDPALNELERRYYIRTEPSHNHGPGRPQSPTYSVNPSVFDSP